MPHSQHGGHSIFEMASSMKSNETGIFFGDKPWTLAAPTFQNKTFLPKPRDSHERVCLEKNSTSVQISVTSSSDMSVSRPPNHSFLTRMARFSHSNNTSVSVPRTPASLVPWFHCALAAVEGCLCDFFGMALLWRALDLLWCGLAFSWRGLALL